MGRHFEFLVVDIDRVGGKPQALIIDDLLALSHANMRKIRDRAREAGFDALLGKPLDLNALRFEIMQAMAKHAQRRV